MQGGLAPPAVWAEADKLSVVQLHVGTQTPVLACCEVAGAPQADGAVVSTRRQVLAAAAEVQAGHGAAVALRRARGQEESKRRPAAPLRGRQSTLRAATRSRCVKLCG